MSRGKVLSILRKAFSPATMFWLMAAWVFLYTTLAIWSQEAFGKYMERLPEDPFLQAPFVIFIIVALVNYIHYAVSRLRDSWLSSPLWLLAPTGALLFLVGFYISAVFSDSGRIFVGTDSIVQPPWQSGRYVVSKIDTGLKDEIIDMGEGGGLIFRLSPRLYLEGGGGSHEVGVFPPTRVGNTYYHILDFGLAPGVRISRDGRVLTEGPVIQKILPPGIRDSFELSPYPYRFAIRMLPEREITKGREKLGVFNLQSPRYSVVIEKGQEIVFEGDSSGPIEVDGLSIDFYGPDYWFWLEGARNPGYMVLAAGIFLLAAGVPLLLTTMAFKGLSDLREVARTRKS
jgi:hypothetical protein